MSTILIQEVERDRAHTRAGRATIVLAGADAWLVTRGHVDVFAVEFRDGAMVGSRLPVLRLQAGGMAFPITSVAPQHGFGLVAVGTPGTDLERHSVEAVLGATKSQPARGWIETWVTGLARVLMPADEAPAECSEVATEPSTALRATGLTVGSRCHVFGCADGVARLSGHFELTLRRGELVLLPPQMWVLAQTDIKYEAAPIDEVSSRPIRRGLVTFNRFLPDLIGAFIGEARAEGATVTRQRADDAASAYTSAWRQLGGLLPGVARRLESKPTAVADADALLAACRLVGEVLELDIRKPGPLGAALHARDPVGAIARASRIRVRAVRLQSDWWRSDGGPLLAWTEDGRRPVALLPDSTGRYVCYDPVLAERFDVTAANAERIATDAYVLYPSVGTGPLSLRDMFLSGLRSCRSDLVRFAIVSLMAAGLSLVPPIVTRVIFNDVIPSANRGHLFQLVGILVAVAVVSAVLSASNSITLLRIDGKLGSGLMIGVWDRLLMLPTRFFRGYSAGNLASRAMAIDAIRQIFSGATLGMLVTGLVSLFQFGFLFHINVQLALTAVALIAAMMLATGLSGYAQLRSQRRITKLGSKQAGLALQLLSNVGKLRVAGAERHAFGLWAKQFAEQRGLQIDARRVANLLRAVNVTFPVVANAILFASAIALVQSTGGLSTGDFIAFLAAFGTASGAALSISSTVVSLLMAAPHHEQLKPILVAEPEVSGGQAEPGILRGDVEVQHIAFRYAPDTPPLLRDLSFHARPGDFVALVGPSGSGKSTVLRVILGFERPENGAVYYDGQDLANLDVTAVRSQIGVVMQAGRLMPGDIFSNIVGASRATMDDAWEAATMAGFDEDIRNMPMGLHTVIGQGQSTLSGGQRQRLMIARALVRKPRILLMDEATSALDNRTQALVTESLDRLNVTRIVIAHRLSTIIHATRIYVIRAGEVVEHGNYDELMTMNGSFAELARRQLA